MTRRRRERTEGQEAEENEAVAGCLDVLRGASALLARHKAELARLLPRRDEKDRESLERLVSDLMEVLSTAGTSSTGSSSSGDRQQQQEGAVSEPEAAARRGAGGGGGVEKAGVKRAKAQQPAATSRGEQQSHQELATSPWVVACQARDALAIPEVLEHVMSFFKSMELLGRLNRVCRLWRRVSEGETLSMLAVQRCMPSALLGGEESLHARLGGSARRCLLAHNAEETSARLMCGNEKLGCSEKLALLVEIYNQDEMQSVMRAKLASRALNAPQEGLLLRLVKPVCSQVKPFSPASMGVNTVHDIFTRHGRALWARVRVMDVDSGIIANLFDTWLHHKGQPPEPEGPSSVLIYTTGPVPVTSMSYAGPPLQAELCVRVQTSVPFNQDEIPILHQQRDRLWAFESRLHLYLRGQPAVYGERFIRTRLAEEAMATKQHGSR